MCSNFFLRIPYWFLLILCFCSFSCKNSDHLTDDDTDKIDYRISIETNEEEGIISPLLMGFNTVYPFESDARWQGGTGPIPEQLKKLGTNILRWPGGTVTTHYHWTYPTGQGWEDSWDPDFDPSKNADDSKMMDIDEYLDITRKMNLEPLIGVNMGSGKRFNRVQDGIDEAKALVQHCIDRGFSVKYYYLDNEPGHGGANYTYDSPVEYAKQVNLYAEAMKKVDPNIKIIINTEAWDGYTEKIIKTAGDNIDFVDIHNYWSWQNATFEKWKSQPQMMAEKEMSFKDQKLHYERVAKKLGYPGIKVISLEWNIGPNVKSGNHHPTEAEAALMVSEQFTQYIQSGMEMATFWPISRFAESGSGWLVRSLFIYSQEGDRQTKIYDMFNLYSDVLSQRKIRSSASSDRLINLAVKSEDGKKIWIYLINKNLDKKTVDVQLSLDDFKANNYKAVTFESTDSTSGALDIKEVSISREDASQFYLSLPRFSLTKITLR